MPLSILSSLAQAGADLAPDPAPRPALDLAALAAFDPGLASRAMGMMFSGGHREEALRWADRLDPLQETDHAPFGKRRLGYAGSCSMAEWALATADLDALRRICELAKTREELFERRAEKIASYCAAAMREGLCELADFLLERMRPIAPDQAPRYVAQGWEDLVKEAAKARRADWLARVLELRQSAGNKFVRGWDLARELFVPAPSGKAQSWFEPGIEALQKADALDWRELPRLARAYAEVEPANWERAQQTLEAAAEAIRLREGEMSGWSRFDARKELEALFYWDGAHPRETPPQWAKLMMDLGVAPFHNEGDKETREPPALALLSKSHASRDSYVAREEREAKRQEQDEKTKALLEAMMSSGASGVEHHYPMSDDRLKGARKISLLALAAAQGYWECATLLAERGVDQKAAARQISAHMSEGPEKAKAEAFFEALALQKVSSKASASRDKRLAKAKEEPAAPARPMRL